MAPETTTNSSSGLKNWRAGLCLLFWLPWNKPATASVTALPSRGQQLRKVSSTRSAGRARGHPSVQSRRAAGHAVRWGLGGRPGRAAQRHQGQQRRALLRRQAQRVGQAPHRGRVGPPPRAPLQRADRLARQPGLLGQLLLREPRLLAIAAQ